jgi:hypothetical protein
MRNDPDLIPSTDDNGIIGGAVVDDENFRVVHLIAQLREQDLQIPRLVSAWQDDRYMGNATSVRL